MSKTTSFFDFAKIENDNENKLKASDGMMLATGLAGDQPVIGYSTDEVKKIVENYKSDLTGLPGNWQVGVAGQGASSPAGALSVGGTDTGKLEFDAWKGQFGIDTDKNFQDSVSRLDYEVKTWAANYGANAERLARMGLSNSGVVDIYGTGVIQAYLQSMNDLYLAKAEGDRQNAEAYKTYSDQYDADLAARTEAKNNKILQGYNYGLGLYTGDNMDAVTTMVRNAGYDEDEIGEIVARLGAVDPSMLPALQAQAKQDQADIDTAIDQLIKSGYKTEMAESAADVYRAKGWSEEKIAKVIQGANGLAGMQSAGQSATGDQALMGGVDAVKALFYDDSGNYLYTGSEAQKESIKQRLRGTEYEAMADQIIAQLDADLNAIKTAKVEDEKKEIENTDTENLTVSGVQESIRNAAATYGEDSDQYKEVYAGYEKQLTDIIKKAFHKPENAALALGVDNDTVISVADDNEITWGEAGTEQKMFYVVNRLSDLYKSGDVGEKSYVDLMSDYLKTDVKRFSQNVRDYVDAVSYLQSLDVNYNVKTALIDVVAKNAEIHSTYTYKYDSGMTISIAKNDKQGEYSFSLRVDEVSSEEDAKVRGVMKDGQDIYYVDGKIYVVDRHGLSQGKRETVYKVNVSASEQVPETRKYVVGDRREEVINTQKTFVEFIKRYAYAHGEAYDFK